MYVVREIEMAIFSKFGAFFNAIQMQTIKFAILCNAIWCKGMQLWYVIHGNLQYKAIQYAIYNVMQCNEIKLNVIQCNAIPRYIILCNAIQCNAMQCNAMKWN